MLAFNDKKLDEIAAGVSEAFAQFEKEGISQKDLDRIKAGQETRFYNSLSSVLGKSSQLAQYNYLTGNPGFVEQDIKNILAVTPADVMRVYKKYIKGKNFVATSFVPKGKANLALENSKLAEVVEEKIVQGAEAEVDPNIKAEYEKTPSSFDRTVEPPYGPAPEVKIPAIWETKLKNGLRVYGIENTEVPLVQFNIAIDGGQLLEDKNKTGVANLTARMLTQGTARKTPQELEEAIQQLGASINVMASKDSIQLSATTLARNYDAVLALAEEILLEPRWDTKEFDLLKQSTANQIRQMQANPNFIAQDEFNKLLYGKHDIRALSTLGTNESLKTITIEDLKSFYAQAVSPSVSRMHIVGALDKNKITKSLSGLNTKWKAKNVAIPNLAKPALPEKGQVYFYDVPGAKQSVIRIGYPALAATDQDFYPAIVANYILGGGGFASQLTQELREGKGYTYGINSSFSGTKDSGVFSIGSGIRTNVTLEAVQLVKEILENYPKNYSAKDLDTTQGFLVKSNARAFETAGAKLGMLDNISSYGWKYVTLKTEKIVKAMTVEQIKNLSNKYLNPDKMYWLIIGDAKTQLPRLKELGFGEPVLLNK